MSSRRSKRGNERRAAPQEALPAPMRWDLTQAAALLVEPSVHDDKYRRGVLGLRTGSAAYPGAAVLGAEAAWHTGLGMLRYTPPVDDTVSTLGLPSPAAAVLAARPETVFLGDATPTHTATDAWVIGSGTDPAQRSPAEESALRALLQEEAPVVIDAGALDLLVHPQTSETTSRLAGESGVRAPCIITPHRGEFLALWRAAGLGDRPPGWPDRGRRDRSPADSALIEAAQALAARLSVTVLLKGSTSVVTTPGGLVYLAGPATPWLATAGTGDVLAGILGALLAAHAAAVREEAEALGMLGASAALLHDAAARHASGDPRATAAPARAQVGAVGRPITALEVAQSLPHVIGRVLGERHAAATQ